MTGETLRAVELANNLQAVRDRIAQAVRASGRDDEPTLIAITKFFPLDDLVMLAEAGALDVGESREQEFHDKVEQLKAQHPQLNARVTKHFIGQVQSNKARRIAAEADVVHTIDRVKIIPKLAQGAADAQKRLDVLIQVDLDGSDAARGGALPENIEALADAIALHDELRLVGLMAVAPTNEPAAQAFSRLRLVREEFLQRHPEATMLSAGMSGDLEEAVEIGATHLRVGSAILGSRRTHR